MLDQYQGTLLCVVNYNDGSFAECDIVDAVSLKPEASIHDEVWLGASSAAQRLPLAYESSSLSPYRFMPAILRQPRTFRRNQFLNFLYIKFVLLGFFTAIPAASPPSRFPLCWGVL